MASRRVGLSRALSRLGFCSRSQAAQLIRQGKVCVNGAVRRDPETAIHLGKDRVEVEGHLLGASGKIYLMLNKPRGIVTSASDERGRDTVYKFLDPMLPWVAPVGRLDKASEGLLLLTNDTEWAARITTPETHVEKSYHVQIRTVADDALVERLRTGIRTKEGDWLRAKGAALLRHGERHSWLEIILDEGKNRHIRRMMDTLGVEVLRLIRIAIGRLALGDLPKGAVRSLTAEEKLSLDRAMKPNRGR